MANDRKVKENDGNSSKRRRAGGKVSTTGSATTDSLGLRRSTRETASKKQSLSSTSSTRKSERLEKRTPAVTPIKKKIERIEKQKMPSPLRKSERSEKHRSLNSSGSKKSEKVPSPPDTKNKKKKREKNEKQQTMDVREGSSNEKQQPKPSRVILKKKRLDARSYRALLRPQARISKGADLGRRVKRKDKQPQEERYDIGASGSEDVEKDGDECSERMDDKSVKESSQLSCEQKNRHAENHDSESRDKLPLLESGDNSAQSSPDGAVQKEAEDDSSGMRVECSVREDFKGPELMESTSERRSVAAETDTGGADKIGTLKRKRNAIDLYSDTSATEASKEICSATADAVSSSPSGSKMGNFIERCVVCSKRQRVDFDSHELGFCSCNAKEVCVQETILGSVEKDGVSCSHMERENGAEDDPALDKTEGFPEVRRQIVHCSGNLVFIPEVPTPIEEDRREPEAGDGTGVAEECHSDVQHCKTPIIFQTEADQNASVSCKLDSGSEGASPDALKVDSSDNTGKLEHLAQSTPLEHKSESSKFVEYWVPVKLSNVQLENYCAALFSNEMSLRSCSKNDSVGALRDLLISARKCCDHPYLLEPSLQSLLTKGLPEVEYLDVGIKASGKLQLLDKILQEMKRRGLRALILFQSFGGSRLGDILDDFLRQRFGPDSYERVDGVVSSKKKQAAMNMFNSKERGRFVFLLENRACQPSIKLSSVDAILLFDSDWNPLNDLRGLQRIHIDSQFEQLKVFRLYTPCTVEEKILNLAKQDMYLDTNIQNITRSHCHMLLIWGASDLFSKLDEFHGGNTSVSDLNILSDEPFLNAVVEELLIRVPQNAENDNKSNCSLISKVKQSGAIYSRGIPLLGEKMQLREEEPPHVFWTKLLQGRYPRWRYLSGSSHRVRKRVQYFNESPRKSEVECEEVMNKRKKVTDNTTDTTSLKPSLEDKRKVLIGGKEGTSGTQAGNRSQSLPRSAVNMGDINHVSSMANEISGVSEGHLIESEERKKLREAQKSLHLLLKPEISKLCEILRLPGDIKGMAIRFLDYIMKNHHVNREPVAILHAFQISVCWTAAALLKHKINRKESLAHAKQLLNFECKEEEAEFIYSKLRMLKKMFYRRIETSMELKFPEDSSPRAEDVSKMLPHATSSQSMASAEEELEEGEIRERFRSTQLVPAKQEQVTDSDKNSRSKQNNFSMGISQFEKICAERLKKILQKQQEEFQKFNEIREKEKAKLDKELTLELALIRTVHKHTSIRLDKMTIAEQDHAKKIEVHNRGWEVLKKNLEALQLTARKEERRTKAHWLEQAVAGKSVELFAKLPLPDSWFRFEQMMSGKLGATHISGLSSEKLDPNISFPIKPGEVLPSNVTKTISSEATEGSVPTGREGSVMDATLDMQPNREDDRMDATVTLQSDGDSNRLDTMLDMQPDREDDVMDASVAVQSNGNSNRMDTTLDLRPNRVDDGMDASVSVQSNGGSNRLDATLNLQLNREDDQVDATTLDMQSNAMHAVRDDNGVDTAVAMQPHRGNNGMDTTCGMQSCREENATDVTISERETLGGDEQHNRADISNSVDLRSLEPTQIDSARNSSLPLDELLRVEHSEAPTSAGAQDEAVSSCEMQNTPEQVQVLSLQLADVLPSGTYHGTTYEDSTPFQQAQIQELPLMGNPAESSSHSESIPPAEDCSEPSLSLPQPITPLLPHLPVERPSVGSGTQVSATSVDTIPGSSNCPEIVHSVGSSTSMSVSGGMGTVPESSNRPLQQTTVTAQMCQPWYHDPLQYEMERIQKEKEQTIKIHAELKLRLDSERDKEIEEIRRKYAAKLQQAEAALVQKRKELEANGNKVFMNKMLADAFRSKFSEPRTTGALGQRQGIPTSFMQQLFQLSSQQHAQRPAPVSGPPAAPPLQVVHQSSALFSSNPVRQHISPVVPPAGNHQVASEVRAPAPHLQPFRPSTSMAAPNIQPVPHSIPSQQTLGNAASTSSMIPQLASRAPTLSSGPFSRNQQLESAVGLAGFSNSSLSALELLLDVGNHPGANQPSLQTLPDLGLSLGALDPAELTAHCSSRGTAVRTAPTADVVCISDDD
ncbi:helicase protein MOM1-like isoform X2 [Macadamia integrifolia]|uniref:helicase protein MOM1-like isoform X2 n=1 Tax=Macadamia integrifolia TaxID=60698 RepID=UPI001C52968B|nr:helicase protein MOM1-like isoform X2 [Macadamia integrifolia]